MISECMESGAVIHINYLNDLEWLKLWSYRKQYAV